MRAGSLLTWVPEGAIMTTRKIDSDFIVIALVGLAHGMSHFFQMVLPPLFPVLKDALGTSYTVLGGAIAVFFTVSGVTQTAAGFLVDRLGARVLLIGGLALLCTDMLLLAVAPSVVVLYVAAAIGGLGNSVFHPADLALLNAKVKASRLGYAFSLHGLGGSLGWVLAPMLVVPVAGAWGWRVAVAVAAGVGLLALLAVATQPVLHAPVVRRARAPSLAHDMRLLVSQPVLLCFAFFALYSIGMIGFQTFAATASAQIYEISLLIAGGALTAFLGGNSVGVLAGGVVAARTSHHGGVVAVFMLIAALLAAAFAARAVPLALLLPGMAVLGFAIGSVGPSRDILVRAVAPAHARGKVYGFVYSGLDLGGLLGPAAFGAALDLGYATWVFGAAAVFLALSIPTLLATRAAPAIVELRDA